MRYKHFYLKQNKKFEHDMNVFKIYQKAKAIITKNVN